MSSWVAWKHIMAVQKPAASPKRGHHGRSDEQTKHVIQDDVCPLRGARFWHFLQRERLFVSVTKLNNHTKFSLGSGADPGFPVGGAENPPGAGANLRFCQKFPKKPHENEKILGRRGGTCRGCPP